VAPLRLGGLRGKQSTPSDWLGGTGEVSTVGERERHGAHLILICLPFPAFMTVLVSLWASYVLFLPFFFYITVFPVRL
jgi:hypothetical protein